VAERISVVADALRRRAIVRRARCEGTGGWMPLDYVGVFGLPRGGPVLAVSASLLAGALTYFGCESFDILAIRIPFTRMWTNWTTTSRCKSVTDSNE
jgi:hypothetical protein